MRTFQRIYELLKIEQIHDFYLVSWKIKIIFKIRNYYFIFMICTISNESDEDSKFTEFLSLLVFVNMEQYPYFHCLLSVKTFLLNKLRKESSFLTKGED